MNALRTAQKEPPRQPTQNSLDPALAMQEVLSGPKRSNRLRSSPRSGESQRRQARAAPKGRSIALPAAATRYGPSVDGVPFRTTGRHGIEDTANLRLPVHGSRKKGTTARSCPTSKLRGGRERAQVTSRAIQLTCSHSSLSRFLVESKAIERNVRSGDS